MTEQAWISDAHQAAARNRTTNTHQRSKAVVQAQRGKLPLKAHSVPWTSPVRACNTKNTADVSSSSLPRGAFGGHWSKRQRTSIGHGSDSGTVLPSVFELRSRGTASYARRVDCCITAAIRRWLGCFGRGFHRHGRNSDPMGNKCGAQHCLNCQRVYVLPAATRDAERRGLPDGAAQPMRGGQRLRHRRATTAIISTRMPVRARGTPPVARAGAAPGSTQASQTSFMPWNSAMSASQT